MTEQRDAGEVGTSRPRRVSLSWLGLAPFFLYVLLVFLLPIGFILYDAFRRTTTSAATRDPVTQQFVTHTKTSFTGANVSQSLKGI
jgi:ABC-type sugar transport system permease subunit